jgi:hypothetical protein
MTSPITDQLADDVIRHRSGAIPALIAHAKALESASNAEIGGLEPLSTAQEAEMLVSGPRRDDYGDARASFGLVARLWAPILGLDSVAPGQVAACMIALKMARNISGGSKHDSYVDIIGYALLWEQIDDGDGAGKRA